MTEDVGLEQTPLLEPVLATSLTIVEKSEGDVLPSTDELARVYSQADAEVDDFLRAIEDSKEKDKHGVRCSAEF